MRPVATHASAADDHVLAVRALEECWAAMRSDLDEMLAAPDTDLFRVTCTVTIDMWSGGSTFSRRIPAWDRAHNGTLFSTDKHHQEYGPATVARGEIGDVKLRKIAAGLKVPVTCILDAVAVRVEENHYEIERQYLARWAAEKIDVTTFSDQTEKTITC